MSFTDILAAVLELSQAEKLQLLHALREEVGADPPAPEPEAGPLARFLPPGVPFQPADPEQAARSAALVEQLIAGHQASGVPIHAGNQITTDEAGFRAIEQFLAEMKERK